MNENKWTKGFNWVFQLLLLNFTYFILICLGFGILGFSCYDSFDCWRCESKNMACKSLWSSWVKSIRKILLDIIYIAGQQLVVGRQYYYDLALLAAKRTIVLFIKYIIIGNYTVPSLCNVELGRDQVLGCGWWETDWLTICFSQQRCCQR